MKLVMCSVYDKKLGVYGSPVYITECSDDDIIEMYRRQCANDNAPLSLFDNDVYKVGIFDDKLGVIEKLDKPEFLVALGDFRYLHSEGVKDVKQS